MPRASEFDEYTIAAGTSISIEIKSAVGSDANRTGDQVVGALVLDSL